MCVCMSRICKSPIGGTLDLYISIYYYLLTVQNRHSSCILGDDSDELSILSFLTLYSLVFLPKMADHRIPGELVVDDMVLGPNVMPETIQKVKSFELKEEDVLIASYVKTGKA